jgi:hypothetical protein
MKKLDLRKEYKHLYRPSTKKVSVVEVPALQFVLVDGQIEPGRAPGTSPSFQEAMQALYSIAYTLKFISKGREDDPIDYTVMALEALWWVEGGEFDIQRPDNWCWTAMIMQPDHISQAMFSQAREQAQDKKPELDMRELRFETFHEGLCMQIMHIGPYADEPATLAKMDGFARQEGYRLCGKHHEIYLGDPRRVDPAKLKTVLRHPIEAV